MHARNFIILLLLLFMIMPVKISVPQEVENETTQTDDPGTKDKKADKKKDKKVLEIDSAFFISLGIDVVSVALIILLIYYPNYRKLDYIFTFIAFNLVIFVLTFVLKYVKLSLGAAFGLFAVFSMLRYRTAGISMKDMTYLFIFIAMGLISAIQLEFHELGILFGIIIAGTFILDGKYIIRRELCKSIRYENIELIKPGNYDLLLDDLKTRTGLNIHRIAVNKIDFLRDTVNIKVYYYE
jgi:hypothetical protein